MAEKLEVDFF